MEYLHLVPFDFAKTSYSMIASTPEFESPGLDPAQISLKYVGPEAHRE